MCELREFLISSEDNTEVTVTIHHTPTPAKLSSPRKAWQYAWQPAALTFIPLSLSLSSFLKQTLHESMCAYCTLALYGADCWQVEL